MAFALRSVTRRRVLGVAALALALSSGTFVALGAATTTTSTTTTTTTVPPETPQAGWTVASSSARGVMVDYRNITIGTAVFRVVRLRARTTLLRWHVGAGDPNAWRRVPSDAGAAISASEYRAGVVAVFNGGFKQAAKAGGSAVDGVLLSALVPGDMTIALNAAGQWSMGVWGTAGFPSPSFHAIAYRQNLGPLVLNGALTPAALSTNWSIWGSPLHLNPLVPRTGLGVDANGNLLYVATMSGVLARSVGRALIAAGAVSGMELDMNPYWPILGAGAPIHAATGHLPVQLPLSEHAPSVYEDGWERDFFVAVAEPSSWGCSWSSAGVVSARHEPQPQPLERQGSGCGASAPTTTTSAPTAGTTTSTTTTATTETTEPTTSTTAPSA